MILQYLLIKMELNHLWPSWKTTEVFRRTEQHKNKHIGILSKAFLKAVNSIGELFSFLNIADNIVLKYNTYVLCCFV